MSTNGNIECSYYRGKSNTSTCRYAYSSVRIQLRSELYGYTASAYSSDKSCMRIRPPHTAHGSCIRRYGAYDIRVRIQLQFVIFKLTYPVYVQSLRPLLRTEVVLYPCKYTPAFEVYMVYSFRRFNHHICMCLCIFVF